MSTENNPKANGEAPPPPKDSRTQSDTGDAVPDTEVEEISADKGPSEAETLLKGENDKLQKELDGTKVGLL